MSPADLDATLSAIRETNVNLLTTAIDNIPGDINVYRGSIQDISEMNGLIAGFNRWVNAFDGSSNGELTTTIATLKTLATTPVSEQYQAEIVSFANTILSKVPNGLNDLQTSQPVDSVGSISTNALTIE